MQFNGNPVVNKRAFVNAMKNCEGNKSALAEMLNVSRITVYNYFKRWPDLVTAFDEMYRHVSKKPPTRPMFVYLIRDKAMGMTKVGVTSDLQRRLSDLQIGCPQELELVGYIESDKPNGVEQEIHNKYDFLRHRGEWFNLAPKDIKEILDNCGGDKPATQSTPQLSLFENG